MTVTNAHSGTNVHEIGDGIFRISTPFDAIPGGFTFNQFLIVDDEPLLFHTGPRRTFAWVKEAMAHVMPVERLRYVSFSHVEADECGALNEWLAAAPNAVPLCGPIAAMLSIEDLADRPPKVLAEGERLNLGRKTVRWWDAPHLPHNWECGYLSEETTRTLFCGDLLTQPGSRCPPVTEADVLGPSEALRAQMGGVAIERDSRRLLEKLAATEPLLLACMHGSSFRGKGADVLHAFGDALLG